MPILPAQYGHTRPYDLLAAAARGHIAFDRRLIDALTADPARTLPDLVRFAGEEREEEDDRADIGPDLLYLFALMPTPEAVPFLLDQMQRDLDDAPDVLIGLANRIGAPAANALLDLFEETDRLHPEVLFVALAAGARGERVEQGIAFIETIDPEDAEFLRGIASEPYVADSSPFVIDYPAQAEPDLSLLPEHEREEFLLSDSADQRRLALLYYVGEEVSDRRRQQLLKMGAEDPDARVRGLAWEVLREYTDEAPVLAAMKARLSEATDLHERACLANALAYHLDVPGVAESIEAAYAEPANRAKALEAMWRTLDRRWVEFPSRHLDDSDLEVRRQAVLGIGYFRLRNEALRLEPLFRDEDLRIDAIYAYALAAPGEDNAYGVRQLEKRITGLAGGLTEEEESELADALEIRLGMSARDRQEAAAPAAAAVKVGRNDPCPCGSGRKYKKCCGSAA